MSKVPTGMEFVGKLSDVAPDTFCPNRPSTADGVADAVRRLMSAVREAIDDRDAEIIALREAIARQDAPKPSRQSEGA
jgi:hypothetical protein